MLWRRAGPMLAGLSAVASCKPVYRKVGSSMEYEF